MIKIVILVLLYFTFPLLIIYICKRWSFLKKLGTIVIAYAFGLLLGSSGILPTGSENYYLALHGNPSLSSPQVESLLASGTISEDDVFVNLLRKVQNMLISFAIPLAFPLLLFSLNIKRWLKYAKAGFVSMILAIVSIIIVIVSGFFIFRDVVPDSWKVAGMLVGVYTGGTPNMASLSYALDVDPNLFLMTNTYDIVIGAVTIFFFITAGPRVFRAFLPPFRYIGETVDTDQAVAEAQSFEDFSGLFKKGRLVPLLKALGISLLIVGTSAGIAILVSKEAFEPVAILSITTLAIIASLIPWINRIEKTFQLGMYFILVFSFAFASMANLSTMFNIGYLGLFGYVLWAYFGSLLLHLLLSKIFRVNADDYLITTTAFIYSPPFVPVIAAALKNKDVIVTGITVGVIGWIIGNYLGVGLGFFLKVF
ncbi:MAG: DUF819 family protein [Bacteroidia bacterium]|nr:MAG: DUF819 family protein [Bacteroidia bacterium]